MSKMYVLHVFIQGIFSLETLQTLRAVICNIPLDSPDVTPESIKKN